MTYGFLCAEKNTRIIIKENMEYFKNNIYKNKTYVLLSVPQAFESWSKVLSGVWKPNLTHSA